MTRLVLRSQGTGIFFITCTVPLAKKSDLRRCPRTRLVSVTENLRANLEVFWQSLFYCSLPPKRHAVCCAVDFDASSRFCGYNKIIRDVGIPFESEFTPAFPFLPPPLRPCSFFARTLALSSV